MTDATFPLRVASAEDAAAVCAIYIPIVETTAISFELAPPSQGEMSRRITETLLMYPWLVAENDQRRVVGYAYAGPHRARAAYGWSVDVTAYVADGMRGRGVSARLYRALLDILRAQNFHAAFAGIALPNPGSIALHESVGFTPVGVYRAVGYKLAAWHDVGWWQRALRDGGAPPQTPIPFPELDKTLFPLVRFP